MPKLDPNVLPQPSALLEHFVDPKHGWLDFEPISKVVQRPKKPIIWPIALPPQLAGTEQPHVPTCDLPSPTTMGCPKASKCPIAHMRLKHLGPGTVIMRNRDAVSQIACHEFFGADDASGKPIYQINYGEQGWKMDVTRTTVPVMGSKIHFDHHGNKIGASREAWEKEVPDLLPYWWPLLKKEGKPLPEAAKRFPQFAEAEEETSTARSGSPSSLPSASRVGRKKRRKGSRRTATASSKSRSAETSSDSPAPDA